VSVAYLIFGATTYLLHDYTNGFPRSVWILGWIFSVAIAEGLRMWNKIWKRTIWLESKSTGRPRTASLKNILVIGGAGYLGSVLVRKLLSRGYRVTVMDALMYGDDSIRDLYGHSRFDLIRGDIRNVETVIRSLQYVDAVVHLGGLVGDPACDLDEKLTLEVNLAANYLVAEAARGLGVQRLVFASTCSVYGGANQTMDERSPLNPASLYSRTKMDSETALLRLADRDGFEPVILRLATLFGLSPRLRFDLVVNVLLAKAITEGIITIHGGDQWRPFVHVDDAAEAVIKALAPTEVVAGEVFNVGADSLNHTISEVAELVQKLVPEAAVVREERADSGANYRVSLAKIRSQLGFEPARSVSDGIREIKGVFEKGTIPDYLEAQYSNHKAMARNHT